MCSRERERVRKSFGGKVTTLMVHGHDDAGCFRLLLEDAVLSDSGWRLASIWLRNLSGDD